MSNRINVVLQADAWAALVRMAPKGQRSRFISQAILNFASHCGKQVLREQLKAEALATSLRDLDIVREWFPLEEEAWQRNAARGQGRKAQVGFKSGSLSARKSTPP